jgi:hypothetical protein
MIKFKLDGKPFLLPESHGELTLGQFLALRELPSANIFQTLQILTGIDPEIWKHANKDIDQALGPALEWMKEPFDFSQFVLPSTIQIGEKKYNVPDSLGIKTFGQKILFETKVNEAREKGLSEADIMDYALAVYFQPEVTGSKFDDAKIEETIKLIHTCRMSEAWPVASFFLLKWSEYLNGNQKNYGTTQARKNSGLEYIGSKSSDTSALSTRFRRALIKPLNKFSKWIMTRYSLRYGTKPNSQDSEKH